MAFVAKGSGLCMVCLSGWLIRSRVREVMVILSLQSIRYEYVFPSVMLLSMEREVEDSSWLGNCGDVLISMTIS
jgi:hypothetical protein